ncbi:MAG: hypothetical protein U0Q19_03700 [Kineosporiaceae bacterium]
MIWRRLRAQEMAAAPSREVLARLVAWAPRLVGCQGGCWKGPRRAWWCERTVRGLIEWITDREPGLDALLVMPRPRGVVAGRGAAEQLAEAS